MLGGRTENTRTTTALVALTAVGPEMFVDVETWMIDSFHLHELDGSAFRV